MSKTPTWDETEAIDETASKPTWDDTVSLDEPASTTLGQDIADFSQGVAAGATFDFADEIRAGLQAGVLNPLDALVTREGAFGDRGFIESIKNIPENYERALQTERQQMVEAQERSPGLYTTGEIAGAVTPYFIPATGLAKGASAIAKGGEAAATSLKASPLLARITGGAAAGASDTALRAAGASTAETPEEFLQDVGEGATFGGVVGGLVPAGGAAIKATGRGLKAGGKWLSELAKDRPFIGAIKYGWRGEKLASVKGIRENLVPRIEKLADDLVQVSDEVGENLAKPARQKIQNAYKAAVEETAEKLKLSGDDTTRFINNALRKQGQIIGEAEKLATQQGRRADIKDILIASKAQLDNITDDLIETDAKVARELSELFEKKIAKEIQLDKEVSKQLIRNIDDDTARLAKETTKISGKNMTPQQINEALRTKDFQELPAAVRNQLVKQGGKETTTQTTKQTLKALEPINDVSAQFAKNLTKTLGRKASDFNVDPQIRKIAGTTYGQLKQQIDDIFASASKDPAKFRQAKQKYTALKEALEIAGVKDLPKDLSTGEIITPDKFAQLFQNLSDDVLKGKVRGTRALRVFDKLDEVESGIGAELKNKLINISDTFNTLKRGGITDAAKQYDALRDAGLIDDTLEQARRQLTEAEQLLDLSAPSDVIGQEGRRIPTKGAYDFILDQGEDFLQGTRGRTPEVEGLTDTLRRNLPQFADDFTKEASEVAELSRIFSPIARGADGAGAEAALSARGVIAGGLPSLVIGAGNVAGRTAKTVADVSGLGTISKVLASRPEALGKFAKPLMEASQRGQQALSSTIYILSQQDEEFRKLKDDLDEAREKVSSELNTE